MDEIRRLGTPWAQFVLDCNRTAIRTAMEWLGDPGLTLPNPVTMSIVLDPAVCTVRGRHFVDVETVGDLTRGMTVVDRHGVLNREPNVEVCWAIDAARWKETVFQTLR